LRLHAPLHAPPLRAAQPPRAAGADACSPVACCATKQDGKCLYTTVREFVENSLDAAESIGVLPEVSVTMCVHLRAAARPPWSWHIGARSAVRAALTHKTLACLRVVCRVRARSEEISASRFAGLMGLAPRERIDEELYMDTAVAAEQQARFSRFVRCCVALRARALAACAC
jgi:hypothetical protein